MFFSSFQLIAALKPESLIDFQKVFASSPLIYSFLTFMSVLSLAIWIYSLITIRKSEIAPDTQIQEMTDALEKSNYSLAKELCSKKKTLMSALMAVGLNTRNMGPQVMVDSMKSEGKRLSTPLWQRLALLNDIAIVSPMLGLLGTVIGMFYAFYDVNRSIESMNTFFDGLGIAVGTTVMGLVVSILSMLFSTTLKYRLIKTLSYLENKTLTMGSLMHKGEK